MRMGAAMLSLNDRELEAKLVGSDKETRRAFFELAKALLGIRDRYQAGIDICDAVCARLKVVFDRLEAEARAAR